MPDIFHFLREYIEYFPLVALLGLLLAGLNLPVSEDLIIITSAIVSHDTTSNMFLILAVIYTGVIGTDFFVYWVGTKVRKGTSKNGFFARVIPQGALDKMHRYLDKYGIFTFIVCRFIPFGVRNTLFFTAGLFDLKLKVFLIYDIVAAMVSINTLFFLTYYFGDGIRRPVKIAGIILFIALVLALGSLVIRMIVKWRKKERG